MIKQDENNQYTATSRTAVETSGSCSSLSNCLTHCSRRCSKLRSAGSFKTDFNFGNKLQNCNLILTTGSYIGIKSKVYCLILRASPYSNYWYDH